MTDVLKFRVNSRFKVYRAFYDIENPQNLLVGLTCKTGHKFLYIMPNLFYSERASVDVAIESLRPIQCPYCGVNDDLGNVTSKLDPKMVEGVRRG